MPMSYRAFILLPADTDASIEQAASKLKDFYNNIPPPTEAFSLQIKIEDGILVLEADKWTMEIGLSCDSQVLEEAKETAENLANGKLKAFDSLLFEEAKAVNLKTYSYRFELESTADPNMLYFNDYLMIVDILRTFKGAIPFEYWSETLM
jgi:hypothetical protein